MPNPSDDRDDTPAGTEPRQYDRTGFYPRDGEGKPFRVWALLGWNLLVVVLIAIAAAVLNLLLLPPGAAAG